MTPIMIFAGAVINGKKRMVTTATVVPTNVQRTTLKANHAILIFSRASRALTCSLVGSGIVCMEPIVDAYLKLICWDLVDLCEAIFLGAAFNNLWQIIF